MPLGKVLKSYPNQKLILMFLPKLSNEFINLLIKVKTFNDFLTNS